MGSENLSHKFTIKDPTFKGKSEALKDTDETSSSHHSMSHTSGTQPVAVSNGPTSSSSSIIKHKPKPNSKYMKLLKLYKQQLLYIETTLNAIESLAETVHRDQTKILSSIRQRVNQLHEEFENLGNSPELQDHEHFDPIKHDIEQLVNDLKSYKMNNDHPDSKTTLDRLVGFPLDVSDSEDDKEKTLVYF